MFLGPAIQDGVLRFVSITQIEKWSLCQRMWAFRYVERRPEPKTSAMEKGIAFHERMDRYHKTGDKILTAMERPGLHLLYEPRDPYILTEVENLGDLSLGGVPVYLKIDLLNLRGYYLDVEGHTHLKLDHAEVQDYKTTSDVEKWSKTPRGLLETVQMPVYGRWAMERVGGDQVRLSHVYFGTKRREAKKVTTLATWDQIDTAWTDIGLVVKEGMVPAARVSRAADLEPNWEACHRCAYRDVCPRPALQSLADIVGPGVAEALAGELGGDMSAFDPTQFLNSLTGDAAPTPSPTHHPAAAPTLAVDETAKQAEIARLEAELVLARGDIIAGNATLIGKAAQDFAKVTDMGPVPQGAGIITSAAAVKAARIQPPDVPASGTTGPTAKPVPTESVATLPPAVQAVLAGSAGATTATPTPTITSPTITPLPAATSEPAKPRRGRKPKAPETAPAVGYVGPDGTGMATDAAPASFATSRPAPTVLELYVDCAVDGLDVESLVPYVDDLCEKLCKQFHAMDVRCAPNQLPDGSDSPLGFGRWKGALAAAARAFPPSPGAYSLPLEGSEPRQVVAEALRGKCAVYVRGVR